MTAQPLTGPFIAAAGYRRGRHFRQASRVRWVAVHTAEGATDEKNLGGYFARHKAGSSHAGIGQDGGYAQFVNYSDTPWTNPPLNEESDTVEICGFAHWTRSQWLEHQRMLDTVARWIAWRCAVRGIPIRHVTGAALRSGTPGIVGHIDVNNVFHASTHWDPGPAFPWDLVLDGARHRSGLAPKPAPAAPLHVAAAGTYVVRAGDSYWKIAQGAYHDGSLWPVIATANGRRALVPGAMLSIPPMPPAAAAGAQPLARTPGMRPPWPGTAYVAVGRRNSQIQHMQRQLVTRGFPIPAGATGYYGPQTRSALAEFQKKHRETWPANGVCGPVTWALLFA